MTRPTIRQRLAGWLAETRSAPAGAGLSMVQPGGIETRTFAGAKINERTALSISAVWSAVNCYVNTLGAFDLYVASRDDRGGRRRAPEHPAYDLIRRRPNRRSTSMRFRQAWIGHVMTRGNGYAEIEWDDRNSRYRKAVALHLIDPRDVNPVEVDGSVWYRQPGGEDLPASDVLHLAMFGWDGLKGYSPVEFGRETLGVAASQRDYQAGLFNNSAAAQGHLEVAGNLKTAEKSQLRTYWNKMHQGPDKAGNIGILEGGMRWVQTNFSPQDAQIILGAKLSIEEVARFWNLPQHKLNLLENANFSTVEQMNLDFYQSSILPVATAIEQELDNKLLSVADGLCYFFFHDATTLLRGDLASQTAQDSADLATGVKSVNEVRIARGLEPIDHANADKHWIATNNYNALEDMAAPAGPIAPDTPGDQVAPADPAAGGPPVEDVQSAALNGAQIASLLSIVQQVALGALPTAAAEGMIAASFPTLGPEMISRILGSLATWTPQTAAADAPAGPALDAMRDALTDPLGRMVRRECQAIRRASRRDDLDAWASAFYGPHAATVAEAIAPALRAFNTLAGSAHEPGPIAEAMARESRERLRDLVAAAPAGELAGALDRLCSSWESNRAAELVAALSGGTRPPTASPDDET